MVRPNVRFAVATMMVASLALVGCSGGGPNAPTPVVNPTPTAPAPVTPVMAPPPTGVSAAMWAIGFASDDRRLYRPESVHLVLADEESQARKANFVAAMQVLSGIIGERTPMDFNPSSSGATFTVTLVPGITLNGNRVGGLTTVYRSENGTITRGTIQFDTNAMDYLPGVIHELIRTLGVMGGVAPPGAGIMSSTPASPLPTEEERKMLLGRYDYPLLAVYTQ